MINCIVDIGRFLRKEMCETLTMARIMGHLVLIPIGVLLLKCLVDYFPMEGGYFGKINIFDGLLFLLLRMYSWMYAAAANILSFIGLEFYYRFSFPPIFLYLVLLLSLFFIVPHITLWMYWKKSYTCFVLLLAVYIIIPGIGYWHSDYCIKKYAPLIDLYHSKERDAVLPMPASQFFATYGKPVFWDHHKEDGWVGCYLAGVCDVKVVHNDKGMVHFYSAGNWPD